MQLKNNCRRALQLFLTLASLCFARVRAGNHYLANALDAAAVLDKLWYNQQSGLWQDLWWNSGAILTTLGDLALLSSAGFGPKLLRIYEEIYAANIEGGFLNDYYDDEGWWALAWIKAYDVTNNETYLHAAESIFADLLTGTNAICGGQWWDKEHTANNAIDNNLYLATAASLANRVKDSKQRASYRSDAQRQVDWFLQSGLIDSNGTVWDHLNITDNRCMPSGPVYSYNQGMAIGALLETYKLTRNSHYLNVASSIAHATIEHLTDHNGILTDPGYPKHVDPTGAQFKGVFARNLKYLHDVSPNHQYITFLKKNADSIWRNDRTSDGRLGAFWQGPIQDISAASQGSALDCLVAAAGVLGKDEVPAASARPSESTASSVKVAVATVTATAIVTVTVAAAF